MAGVSAPEDATLASMPGEVESSSGHDPAARRMHRCAASDLRRLLLRPAAAESSIHGDESGRLCDLRLHECIARRQCLALGIENHEEVDRAGMEP